MPYRTFEFWNKLLSSMQVIAGGLITLCAFAGAASAFVKGERQFKLSLYLFEVVSSMSAGTIVYLFLRATSTPEEWIVAISGLSAYFGTKLLAVFYTLLVQKLQGLFNGKNASGSAINEKGDKS